MFDTHISAAPPNSSMWTHMWQPCRKRFTFWVAKCLGRPTSPSKSSKCSISDHVSPTQTIPWQARIGRAEYMIGLDIFDDIFTVYTYVTKRYISQNQTIPKGCPEKSDYIGRHIMTHLSWYLFKCLSSLILSNDIWYPMIRYQIQFPWCLVIDVKIEARRMSVPSFNAFLEAWGTSGQPWT